MAMIHGLAAFAAAFLATMAPSVPPQSQDTSAPVADIAVVVRGSGAPVWTATREGRTLVLVGAVQGLPSSIAWSPLSLERAAQQANRVLLPIRLDVSLKDIVRVTWNLRTAALLPEGTTSADYLSAERQQRLERLMETDPIPDWRTRSFFLLGRDLTKRGGLKRNGWIGVQEVERAARRNDVPVEVVGTIQGTELVDAVLQQSPTAYVPCIDAAIDAAEGGPRLALERGEAWGRNDIPSVLANPLDIAMAKCWPWGEAAVGARLRGVWLSALQDEEQHSGITLAITPLRLLAEPEGVLDALQAAGYHVDGPIWRADSTAPPAR